MAVSMRKSALEQHIARLLAPMELSHWRIKVAESDQDGPCYADIEVTVEQCAALITVYAGFWGLSIEDQGETLVHELAHVATKSAEHRILATLEPMLSKRGFAGASALIEAELEALTDYIARLTTPRMPKWEGVK